MDFSVLISNYPNVCHLCLTIEHLVYIHEQNVLDLLYSLNIGVKDEDRFPKTLCSNCCTEINKIYSFIEACRANQELLKSVLLERNVGVKTIESESDCDNDEAKYALCDIENHTIESNNDEFNSLDSTTKKEIHETILKLTCAQCKKSFLNRTRLSKHYRENKICCPKRSKYKKHVCSVCSREFRTNRQKVEHMNVHFGNTPYKCTFCEKGFKFKSNLYVHIYRHKLALGQVEKKLAYTDKRINLNLKCETCDKIYTSRSGYRAHLLTHSNTNVTSSNKNDEGNTVDSTKLFLCNFCAKSFNGKSNLDTHLRTHTGDRPYECVDCGNKFKEKGTLDRHKLNHLQVRPKPFCCDVCQKTFTTNAHMKIHKRIHTGEKPYECTFCEKSFNYKSQWKIHLRIHTGEAPYACRTCNTKYHDKGSLRKHQKRKSHVDNNKQENT